jgi:DNA processing protein
LHIAADSLEDLLARPRVAIVGSRTISAYGKAVTAQLAGDLARAGVVIVSGLAIGTDAVAHRAALDAGGLTIAVLPASLQTIYPAQHYQLAMRIMQQGGALVSEYDEQMTNAYKGNFVARNRIVSGLSHVVLITEAAAKSGTLHTAAFALEQGREVMAVPGNITSPTSTGTNTLIKNGAQPVLSAEDVLHVLGIAPTGKRQTLRGDTPEQQQIIDALALGESDGNAILQSTGMPVQVFDQHLTMLEITGKIRPLGNNKWSLT